MQTKENKMKVVNENVKKKKKIKKNDSYLLDIIRIYCVLSPSSFTTSLLYCHQYIGEPIKFILIPLEIWTMELNVQIEKMNENENNNKIKGKE